MLLLALLLGFAQDPHPLVIHRVDVSGFPTVRVEFSVQAHQALRLSLWDPGQVGASFGGERQPFNAVIRLPGEEEARAAAIVLDLSGSIAPHLDAIRDFLHRLPFHAAPGQEVLVVEIRSRPVVAMPPGPPERLALFAPELVPRGNSAIRDGIVMALEALAELHSPGAVLVISDGLDNASRATAEDVQRMALSLNAPLHAMAVGSGPGRQALLDLAKGAGGFPLDLGGGQGHVSAVRFLFGEEAPRYLGVLEAREQVRGTSGPLFLELQGTDTLYSSQALSVLMDNRSFGGGGSSKTRSALPVAGLTVALGALRFVSALLVRRMAFKE